MYIAPIIAILVLLLIMYYSVLFNTTELSRTQRIYALFPPFGILMAVWFMLLTIYQAFKDFIK